MDSSHQIEPPDTRLTKTLRTLWECTNRHESWPDWYARQCEGGSPNGRAVASALFDRARRYWPDFYSPADAPAVAVWAWMFFDALHPFITPEVIELAVDQVAAAGVEHPVPGHFTQAAERILAGAE